MVFFKFNFLNFLLLIIKGVTCSLSADSLAFIYASFKTLNLKTSTSKPSGKVGGFTLEA